MPKPLYGQVSLSGTAAQINSAGTANGCIAFTIKAPVSNQHTAYLGDASVTTATGHALDPGDEITYERIFQNGQPVYQLRPSDFYAVGTSGDVVTWLASP